jgi:5'-nucleotidase (lipoprotein e(P4) family)
MSLALARAHMNRSWILLVLVAACDGGALPDDGGPADIATGQDKADGATPGIEVQSRIKAGTTDFALSTAVPRLGYIFFAGDNTTVTLEVTHAGTSSGLDTKLLVYGPRLADGSYPKTIATDEDSGYGKLSRIDNLKPSIPGFYLVEVTFGASATPVDKTHGRLSLSCNGTCESLLPVAPMDEGVKWYRRAAERRSLTLQSFGLATAKIDDKAANATGNWAVILDVDETTLNNSPYQEQRGALGLGFSPNSWQTWVDSRSAQAIDGVVGFTQHVQSLGGKVVLVTNRTAAQCSETEDNLKSVGVAYDEILCLTDVSDKNPRFAAVAAGTAPSTLGPLNVLMYVGDNIQDFPMLTQDIRKQPDSAFSAFGDTFIQIPNPMYGSFDKNAD